MNFFHIFIWGGFLDNIFFTIFLLNAALSFLMEYELLCGILLIEFLSSQPNGSSKLHLNKN